MEQQAHVILDGGPGKGFRNLIQKSQDPQQQQHNSKDTMMLSLSHDQQKDLSINPDTYRVSNHL